MPSPRTVVFDLGQVLLRWDRAALYRAHFGSEDEVERFLASVVPMEWHMRLDEGRDWEEALAERIALFPEHESLIRAYRARFRDTIPAAIEGTVEILESLHAGGVDLLALTNFPVEVFEETRDRFAFFRLFRGIVVSGHEKVMKPDPAIYRLLTTRYGADPERSVFIDDRHDNVDAARTLGFTGIVFEDPQALRRDLAALGLPA
jgi:2-haloacid dehalogenase